MKTKDILVVLVLVTFITSCDINEKEEIKNLKVEKYIELLKLNQYDSLDFPNLVYSDIPALLEYSNEKQIITNFPHNPFSSLYQPYCSLGIHVLWTIESVRVRSIESAPIILRFPSKNPILAKRNSTEIELVEDEKSHEIVSRAYYIWWYSNRNNQTDPLENTEYKWY